MNSEQIASLIRAIMAIVGTTLINQGVINQHDWDVLANASVTIVGAGLVVAPIIWAMVRHTKKGQVEAVAEMKETNVKSGGSVIEVKDPELARAALASDGH
jgi:hypothetical protein